MKSNGIGTNDNIKQGSNKVSCFLLDSYERGLTASTPFHGTTPAVSSIGLSSGADRDEHLDVIAEATQMQVLEQRLYDMSIVEEDMEENVFNHSVMGGASQKAPSIDRLEVIGIDETVHDQPSHEDPPDEPSPCDQAPVFPAPQRVLCEDDIIGARASIVYEDCLRQLATLVILPADKCSSLLKTDVLCNCVAPFKVKITSRGHINEHRMDLSQWTQHVEVEFPAYNCSYTTMENDTKVIIHVATIDKQQTSWNSVVMEKESFIQTVDKMTSQIKLVEICTYAHTQIGALMNPDKGRYKDLRIHHSLDMWHGAKNLVKKSCCTMGWHYSSCL
ncbi:uncharacterized protein LOC122996337 [Thunnus albacares]|uniref:uncharacterized protein LOC122996337 n=3 Tax=Thunnus TaxID=8234 RepID=UPI001CF617CB|nr:uncharacterized protein LOC122996337 [Thunnus albacares]